ncbi:MAG: homoprotocatechuate degradation operon regulator HpaR [Reyranella sp.]|uniref:homoprotocatechuate degradation operon regulator HpaR n=1 Tax=Reyranella sp. TaxID=1929291 RepID=UPI001AD287C9|nr:homoprotocatechuate degradation operon regulator HpaR [Reyranella sp.]MBN9086129.1 homoprotocatechuate degradation operon regulator HpaR [Reyranella sp.]
MADRRSVSEFPRPRIMDDRRSLPIALLRAREAVMAYFRPHHRKGGITEQQWRVIRVLHLDGEMDAARLAQRSYLLAPSLSRILKDLEASGHLRRRPDDGDSRRSLLSLSPKGTAMVTGVAPFLDRIHRDIAGRFGRERVDQLLALLDELERALAAPAKAEKRQGRERRR